jgi:cell division inhibitor SulA
VPDEERAAGLSRRRSLHPKHIIEASTVDLEVNDLDVGAYKTVLGLSR